MPPKSNKLYIASTPICEELRNITFSMLESESSKHGVATIVIDDINTEISPNECAKVYGSWHLEKKYGGTDTMLDAQRYAITRDGIFSMPNLPKIKNVIFNDPATIVFWGDGTKTVVKAVDEPFDPEKGLSMAICKKVYGNNYYYYEKLKKWLPKEEKKSINNDDPFYKFGKALQNTFSQEYKNEKTCKSCMHKDNSEYCEVVMCINKNKWEGSCKYCKYHLTLVGEFPCNDCDNYNRWEARDEK